MSRPEATFWDYLRNLLPAGIHYSRIESETSAGFPDVHYTLEGVTGAIELKVSKQTNALYPFSGENGLRKTQKDWIRDELAAGGKVLIGLCAQYYQLVFFLNGEYWDSLDRMTLAQVTGKSLLHWKKGSVKEVRAELRKILVNKA